MKGVTIKREAAISALINAWTWSTDAWTTINSLLTARTKKYYIHTKDVEDDLKHLDNKELLTLFEDVFINGAK